MGLSPEIPVAGVRGVEHTADVGLAVEGPDLPELFLRGALGAMWLVLERDPEEDGGEAVPSGSRAPDRTGRRDRDLNLTEEDLPGLFRSWLRALLFWEETEGFVVTGADLLFLPVPMCSSPDGQAFGLQARVRGVLDRGPRVREIKGVTLHRLTVTRREKGWHGQVIFDV